MPVIDPSLVALKWVEALVEMKLAHSKRTYPRPSEREILRYEQTITPSPKETPGSYSRTVRLGIISPVVGSDKISQAYNCFIGRGIELHTIPLDRGPTAIESSYDQAYAVPDLLGKVRAGQAFGLDAIVLDRVTDPGLEAAQELADIPVVGALQCSMHLTSALAHRFSVITTSARVIPRVRSLAQRSGFADKVSSIRALGVRQSQQVDRSFFIQGVMQAAIGAVEEDGAHMIVLGGTEMIGLADEATRVLDRAGYKAPVIESSAAGIHSSRDVAELELAHSRCTHPRLWARNMVAYSADMVTSWQ